MTQLNTRKLSATLLVPGYDLFRIPRPDRRGGGVAVIHKQTITRSTNSQFTYLSFESLCCDLTLPGTSSSFKLIAIYRATYSKTETSRNGKCISPGIF